MRQGCSHFSPTVWYCCSKHHKSSDEAATTLSIQLNLISTSSTAALRTPTLSNQGAVRLAPRRVRSFAVCAWPVTRNHCCLSGFRVPVRLGTVRDRYVSGSSTRSSARRVADPWLSIFRGQRLAGSACSREEARARVHGAMHVNACGVPCKRSDEETRQLKCGRPYVDQGKRRVTGALDLD